MALFTTRLRCIAIGVTFSMHLPCALAASDANWPQWRGPNRDCFVAAGSAPWPQSLDSLEQLWRVELGPSYSGPIVWGDRLFVTETKDEKFEVVHALDRATGRELWKTQWEGSMSVPFFARDNGDWIRSTPACDGESLYVGGMRDMLVCLNIADGAIRWKLDFPALLGSDNPGFGLVCSPLIDGDSLYIQAANSVLRIDKHNGKVLWRSLESKDAMMGSPFSSPVIATIHGKRQLVAQTRQTLAGLDLETGQSLWAIDVPAFRGMNILTPMVIGNRVLTSTYKNKTYMYDVERTDASFSVHEAWTLSAQGYMSSPVVVDDFAYLHLGNGRLSCIDLKTGKQRWRTKRFGKYWSMAVNQNKLLALDQRGGLVLIALDPAKATILSKKRVSDAETWAHIAVVNEDIYIRELNAIAAHRWPSAQDH